MNLYNYYKIVYSQDGEEGILKYILDRLPQVDKCCVEFGAWDGKHLSNTFNFVENDNYRAIYIEGDREKYQTLVDSMARYNVMPVNAWVDFETNNLEDILDQQNYAINFDLLSIDIDGYDYQVFKSMKKYQPKIVIIEFNAFIKPEVESIHHGESAIVGTSGSSILSITNLALEKGYFPVCVTGSNVIFVDNQYADLFPHYNVKDMFTYASFGFQQLKFREMLQKMYYAYIREKKLNFLNWRKKLFI